MDDKLNEKLKNILERKDKAAKQVKALEEQYENAKATYVAICGAEQVLMELLNEDKE